MESESLQYLWQGLGTCQVPGAVMQARLLGTYKRHPVLGAHPVIRDLQELLGTYKSY